MGDLPDFTAVAAPDDSAASRQVWRVRDGVISAQGQADRLAVELPVALECNGVSYAVMLATPADLEDFALGFCVSEGIVRTPQDVYDIDALPSADGAGVVVQVRIASACEHRLKERRRTLSGKTGCGLCGVEALPDAIRPIAPVAEAAALFPVRALGQAAQAMREQQALFAATGATHAAGWADRQGRVLCVREDVGRHNALDKLIGALFRTPGFDPGDGFVMVSSRASFEMVQKTAAAGIGVLAAVSAPTSMAVDLAQRLNVALAGFVRSGNAALYAHPSRFIHS